MKLSDAKKILSGVYRGGKAGADIGIVNKKDFADVLWVHLNDKDIEFCLRQLALKTVREKEKGK